MIRKVAPGYVLLLMVLIAAFSVAYRAAAGKRLPNWDERASIDIALGIRPSMVVRPDGLPSGALHVEKIIGDSAFTAADYERFNTPAGVVQAVMRDNSNSVLYYLSLHYWIKAVGLQNSGLRLFSILVALFNLLLIARLTGWLLPQRPAWVLAAVVLAGLNPLFFQQATAVRGYMLCVCFLLLATLQWLTLIGIPAGHSPGTRIADGSSRNPLAMVWYPLLAVLALFCHYFAIAIILPQVMGWIAYTWRRQSTGAARLQPAIALALIILPLSMWYVLAREEGVPNMQMLDRAWLRSAMGGAYETSFFNYGKQLFNATAAMLGFDYRLAFLSKTAWQLVAGAWMALLVMIGLLARMRERRVQGSLQPAASPGGWSRYPLLFCWIAAIGVYSLRSWLSGHLMIFERTYLVFLLPFLVTAGVVVLAGGATIPRLKVVCVTCLIGWLLVNTAGAIRLGRQGWRPIGAPAVIDTRNDTSQLRAGWNDMRALARQIGTTCTARDTLVYGDWQTAHLLNYFLRRQPNLPQRVDTSLHHQLWILPAGGRKHCLVLAPD